MVIKSSVEIEIPVKGIYQFITSNPSRIDDDKVIFIDGETGEKLTYGELKSKSKKFAAGLIEKANFKRGNVLAIFSHNKVCAIYQ
jgi:4-coumarate--CoA ligase